MPLDINKIRMQTIHFLFVPGYTLFDVFIMAAFAAALERGSWWALLPAAIWFFSPRYEGEPE